MARSTSSKSISRTREQGSQAGTEPAQCRRISEETANLLQDLLVREVEAKQGEGLKKAEIENAIERLKANLDNPRFQRFLEKNREGCFQTQEEHSCISQRTQVLERVLVKRFAHLFPEKNKEHHLTLQRDNLPGILHGMRSLVGSHFYDRSQHYCKDLFQAIEGAGLEERWERAYHDTRLNEVALAILLALVPAFRDPEARYEWLYNLIERSLISQGKCGPPPFDRAQYYAWLQALFEEPRQLMATTEGQADLRGRCGEERFQQLSDLLRRLDS